MTESVRRDWSEEVRREATLPARLKSRFRAAEARIKRIAAGEPPLTDAQREYLAEILTAPQNDAASA